MYKQDYIVRIFTEFAKAMTAIVKLKLDKDYDDAEVEVKTALKKFTDSDTDFLLSFDEKELVIELAEKRKLPEEQLQIIAELLFQTGEIRKAKGINEDFNMYWIRSLEIFRFISSNQTQTFSMEVMQRISLLEQLTA